MNRRQRKKKSKQEITVFINCALLYREEEYRKMRESIEYQLKAGSRRIVIKQESEAEA